MACALLFWLSALGRFATYDPLRRVFKAALADPWQRWLKPSPSPLWIEVSALDLPRLPDGSRPRLVAQLRLNGRVLLQRTGKQLGDPLRLPLPHPAHGLLEVRVAALSSAACMIAGASEHRWLDLGSAQELSAPLAFSLPLRLFTKPLCA